MHGSLTERLKLSHHKRQTIKPLTRGKSVLCAVVVSESMREERSSDGFSRPKYNQTDMMKLKYTYQNKNEPMKRRKRGKET